MRFQKVRERLIFATKWVRIYDDEVRMPDGSRGYYTRVASASAEGGAHVVPRLPDGRVLLIKANRYPAGEDIWEFPRGVPDACETFEEAATRELFEESGLKASKLSFLGYLRAQKRPFAFRLTRPYLKAGSCFPMTLARSSPPARRLTAPLSPL